MASKAFSKSLVSLYLFLLRRLTSPFPFLGHHRNPHAKSHKHLMLNELSSKTLVVDVEGGLLRSPSLFPYFMLVALEAGGYLRGLLLLLLDPVLRCAGHEAAVRFMTMIAFCGLRADRFRAGRAVLPKYFLEEVGLEGFEVLRRGGRRVCVSCMPRVMVEGFLKEYLEVEVVVARELKVVGGYFTGFMEKKDEVLIPLTKLAGEGDQVDGHGFLGFGSYKNALRHHLISYCEEVYLVSETEKKDWHPLPRSSYPKPLVFHDGRLAFRPTPTATLAMFTWLPFGILLAVVRIAAFLSLPYRLSIPGVAFLGLKSRIVTPSPTPGEHGRLYVCNHRTLLDPIYVSGALGRPLSTVTYSLSRLSEIISPITTVRLTRNRDEDRRRMEELLRRGNLVVCPEGTTCREPYLLRFSPLFAELVDEVVPVALESRVGMFYATTAGGFKGLDPFYFNMNPMAEYEIEFLAPVATGTGSRQAAKRVQEEIGKALGYECTSLTRRDKYTLLAGNEGLVGK